MNTVLLSYIDKMNSLKAENYYLDQEISRATQTIWETHEKIVAWNREIEKLRDFDRQQLAVKRSKANLLILKIMSVFSVLLLAGCERGSRPVGTFFPSYPCIVCSDGSQYCGDVVKRFC